jgi:CBS domain containing-hemolysin-like protein
VSALLPIAIVLLLIAVNGLFVAAEFAIVGAPRATLERRAAAGHRVSRLVAGILRDPRNQDRYIATAQLGITFATLGLGMYGEHQLARWIAHELEGTLLPTWLAAHTLASILAITGMTYLHVVIGEMVPKSLALQHAESTALRVTPPMLLVRRLLYPLVIVLNAIGNGLLRLIGIDRSQGAADQYYSTEELEFVVEESLQYGLIERGAGDVLRELFDLGELTAEDIMAPRVQVHGLRVDTPAIEVARMLREHPHTRYPVYREDLDDIIGVVHVRRLTGIILDDEPLQEGHAQQIPYVPASTPVESAVRRMRERHAQFAVVLDEHGGTAGIITSDDVSEEILGRVSEGETPGEIFRDATGRLHMAGTVRLDELGEQLDCTIEHDEVDTVSGLVLALLERPPRVGDVVEYEEVRIQVARIDGRGVADAVVTRIAPPGGRAQDD